MCVRRLTLNFSIFFSLLFCLHSHRAFNIENHITLYPSNYRGRTVTEANVQDYISNIVSKYLPPDLPPWQICVIPLATNSTRPDEPIASTSTADSEGQSSARNAQNDSSSVRTDNGNVQAKKKIQMRYVQIEIVDINSVMAYRKTDFFCLFFSFLIDTHLLLELCS